ncbi:MAG: CoA pyrophosphatase [Nitrospinota bacterium]|nr:MAG: CoA pyrophosphatase [Nitrospinota bacterium]
MDLEARLREILARRTPHRIRDQRLTPAAVLLPLYKKNGEYYLLFTQRTEQLRHHKGQIAFPGGRYQPGDPSLLHTALRESEEEVGLKAEDVHLLGDLDDVATFSSLHVVTPFVGTIPYPYPFRLNRQEVAALIEVPLAVLADPATCREEDRFSGDRPVRDYVFLYQGYRIWGVTARILRQFLDLLSTHR